MVWRAAGNVFAVVAIVAMAGCSNSTGPDWNLPTPVPAGNYATAADNNTYLRTNSTIAAAIGEGVRLANILVDPYRVDTAFTHLRAVQTYITTGPSVTSRLIGDIADQAPLHPVRAGVGAGRETTTQPSGTAPHLYTALWELDTPTQASAAVDAIISGLLAGRDDPTVTPPLAGLRTRSEVNRQTVIDTAGKYPTATALRPVGRVIAIAESGGDMTVPRARLQQLATAAIATQVPALATYRPPNDLVAPQPDPMQSRAVYSVGDGSESNVIGSTYTAEGGLHWESDASVTAPAFERAGVSRIVAGLSTVYRARSSSQARDLAAALLPTQHQVDSDSSHLPAGARCRRSTDDSDELQPIYTCTIAVGNLVGAVSSNHRQDVEQQITAQADLLRD